jgi:SAM-dependent MidA family methyltransferase
VRWHRSLEEVPADGPPTVYIANEFFDALPVHQLQRTERGWWVITPLTLAEFYTSDARGLIQQHV